MHVRDGMCVHVYPYLNPDRHTVGEDHKKDVLAYYFILCNINWHPFVFFNFLSGLIKQSRRPHMVHTAPTPDL